MCKHVIQQRFKPAKRSVSVLRDSGRKKQMVQMRGAGPVRCGGQIEQASRVSRLGFGHSDE